MTIAEAEAALSVPGNCANYNVVQDGQARLREALRLANRFPEIHKGIAPSYVVTAVNGLNSWINHCKGL